MAGYIPANTALDPVGEMMGKAFMQNYLQSFAQRGITSDTNNLLEYLRNMQNAQQYGGAVAGGAVGGGLGSILGGAMQPDLSGAVARPQLKTPQMQQVLLQMELGKILDPTQRAQIEKEQAQAEYYRAQADALRNPSDRSSDFFRQPYKNESGEWRKGLYSMKGELVRDMGPATPSEVGETRTPIEQQRHDAALAAGHEPGTPGYWDFMSKPSQPTVSTQLGADMAAIKTRMGQMRDAGYAEDSPEMQSLERQYNEKAKLTGTQVNMPTAPTAYISKLYDTNDSNAKQLAVLDRLLGSFEPGGTGETTVGPIQGLWTYLQDSFGIIPPEKKEFLQDTTRLFSTIRQLNEEGRLSDQDYRMLQAVIPKVTTNPEAFRAAIQSLRNERARDLRHGLTALDSFGYQIPNRGWYDGLLGGSAAPQTQQNAPRIISDSDYDALPSGAQFIDPNGALRRKP